MKKNEKLCTKRVSESVSIFVCGHLSLCKDVKSIGTDDFLERKKLGKGGYYKDDRSLGGRGGRPNAVSISNNDVIV